jgi:hypothetical protein
LDSVALDKVAFESVALERVAFERLAFDRVAFDRLALDRVALESVAFDRAELFARRKLAATLPDTEGLAAGVAELTGADFLAEFRLPIRDFFWIAIVV